VRGEEVLGIIEIVFVIAEGRGQKAEGRGQRAEGRR